jgi:hypothetical protein
MSGSAALIRAALKDGRGGQGPEPRGARLVGVAQPAMAAQRRASNDLGDERLKTKSLHGAEVLNVAGEQDEPMLDGGGGDECIGEPQSF